ncbi:MAG: agmatine deiminase family protein [Muribaculaceae bacterium]|nr:agmatine deiminase family protein [Muribaculaceae bacterium]
MRHGISSGGFRLAAEWDPRFNAVVLSWPHAETDWADMLPEVTECYIEMLRAFLANGVRTVVLTPEGERLRTLSRGLSEELLTVVEVPTNDTWVRDYGPLTSFDAAGEPLLADFQFNGWGLKFAADRDNQVNGRLKERGIIRTEMTDNLGFVLEGGSVESDGEGTILTTTRCLLSPNRNNLRSKEQVEERLRDLIGAERVLWLDHGALEGDDTDSHVDTLARLVSRDTIVYTECSDSEDSHFEELSAMKREILALRTADGNPYNTIGLPLPDAIYDSEGQRLPATYANFLITPQAVFLPTYAQPRKDRMAADMLSMVFIDRPVVSVDCRALIRQHGSLHCATMQIPSSAIPL